LASTPEELDDVVSELGLHQIRNLALLERKNHVLKRFDHRTTAEKLEIATFGR